MSRVMTGKAEACPVGNRLRRTWGPRSQIPPGVSFRYNPTACQLTYGSQKRKYPISGHDRREPVAFICLACEWRNCLALHL